MIFRKLESRDKELQIGISENYISIDKWEPEGVPQFAAEETGHDRWVARSHGGRLSCMV